MVCIEIIQSLFKESTYRSTHNFSKFHCIYHIQYMRYIFLYQELDPFLSKIRTVAKYLVCIMQDLSEVETMPKTSKESGQLIEHHQQIVKSAFRDQRFISLQSEGESIINCLRREDIHMGHSEDYRLVLYMRLGLTVVTEVSEAQVVWKLFRFWIFHKIVCGFNIWWHHECILTLLR